jgi:deoxycytidylate deaminase
MDNQPDILELLYPVDSEVVFGLVSPVGTDLDFVESQLRTLLELKQHTVSVVRLSSFLPNITNAELDMSTEYRRIVTYQDAGNKARKESKRSDILALHAIAEITSIRDRIANQPAATPRMNKPDLRKRRAFILRSLKRPEEAATLRAVYGSGFFLIGVHTTLSRKIAYLKGKGLLKDEYEDVIKRDESQEVDPEFGQDTRDTFELADAFISDNPESFRMLKRVINLLYGSLYTTPSRDEAAMYHAYAAATRSADLARQVGAVVTTPEGDVQAVGCNDVPRPGGGLYWEGDPDDQRDFRTGKDPNDREKLDLTDRLHKLVDRALDDLENESRANECGKGPRMDDMDATDRKRLFRESGLLDITEYGRSVHAEMDAMLSCARRGICVKGGTVYSTTFPCHNCTRHIIAAGVRRVVYCEPYPKSKALSLHKDAIRCEALVSEEKVCNDDQRVIFEPFLGVGPRRYFDLFSMRLQTGKRIERKKEGRTIDQQDSTLMNLRLPLTPYSYLQREEAALAVLSTITRQGSDANASSQD